MEVLHNKGVALLLCLLMIACSCLLGAGTSLRQLRRQTQDVFLLGSDGGGMGVSHDLRELAAQSYNLTVLAKPYLPQNDRAVATVLERREALLQATSPKESHRAAQELATSAKLLAGTLQAMELNQQDQTLLQKTLINLDNTLGLLATNDYNPAAARFNRVLSEFPSNILGPVTGVRPLELYE
ncbi:MAG: LemA family protein [Oscillospiraceae bacterium]|jgi:hypothetical protein